MHASHVINYKIQNLQIVLKMLKKLRSGTTLENFLLILKLLGLDLMEF